MRFLVPQVADNLLQNINRAYQSENVLQQIFASSLAASGQELMDPLGGGAIDPLTMKLVGSLGFNCIESQSGFTTMVRCLPVEKQTAVVSLPYSGSSSCARASAANFQPSPVWSLTGCHQPLTFTAPAAAPISAACRRVLSTGPWTTSLW